MTPARRRVKSGSGDAFGRGLDGGEHGARFVPCFHGFFARNAALDDAGACGDVERVATANGRTDGDGKVEVPGLGDISNRATVDTARARLQLADDLHSAQLGRARQGAGGEGGAE